MVQSIWLEFDKKQMTKENIQKITKIIKDNFKTYSYVDDKYSNTSKFAFLDCSQIKKIANSINLEIDDEKRCDCGCYSTTFERVAYFIDLEFNYGKILNKQLPEDEQPYTYFQLGRNVWGSIGLYYERLNILRFILETIKKELDKQKIHSTISLDDCDDCFVDYFKGGKKNE